MMCSNQRILDFD
jgi:hypothetical protein